MRVKRSVQTLPEKYQVCAAAFGNAGDQVGSQVAGQLGMCIDAPMQIPNVSNSHQRQ